MLEQVAVLGGLGRLARDGGPRLYGSRLAGPLAGPPTRAGSQSSWCPAGYEYVPKAGCVYVSHSRAAVGAVMRRRNSGRPARLSGAPANTPQFEARYVFTGEIAAGNVPPFNPLNALRVQTEMESAERGGQPVTAPDDPAAIADTDLQRTHDMASGPYKEAVVAEAAARGIKLDSKWYENKWLWVGVVGLAAIAFLMRRRGRGSGAAVPAFAGVRRRRRRR